MAIEEVKKQSLAEKSDKNRMQYQVQPKYGAWIEDEERLILEIILPGVKKDQIQMKSLKDYFMLRANRENIQYILDLELNMEIVPEKTKATYEEGLLRTELKRFNPLEAAYIVPINGTKRENPSKENENEQEDHYWILPEVVKEVDYEHNKVEIEISIPGVKEDQICLKILPEWFNLIAKREKFEYRANSGFGSEVIPEKTTAEYSNGLLKIHLIIHNRLDDAKNIQIG